MRRLAKNAAKLLLRRLGYEVRRAPVRVSRETLVTQAGVDSEYYTEYSTRYPVFAPWTHPDFQAIFAEVAELVAGSPERGYTLISFARYAKNLPGDFAECGVYQGGSALWLCRALEDTHKTLYLFDSFQGLPKPDPRYDPFFKEGQYAATAAAVKERLGGFEHITDFREGWIPDTFAGLEGRRYAFANIDLDLYQPTLDCCAYIYPRLVSGGVMLFDEYGWASSHGEKAAVDEYFADKRDRPIALITGQAVVLKSPQ